MARQVGLNLNDATNSYQGRIWWGGGTQVAHRGGSVALGIARCGTMKKMHGEVSRSATLGRDKAVRFRCLHAWNFCGTAHVHYGPKLHEGRHIFSSAQPELVRSKPGIAKLQRYWEPALLVVSFVWHHYSVMDYALGMYQDVHNIDCAATNPRMYRFTFVNDANQHRGNRKPQSNDAAVHKAPWAAPRGRRALPPHAVVSRIGVRKIEPVVGNWV